MTKYIRAILIFVSGLVTTLLLSAIIPQFNLVVVIVLGLSFSLIAASFILKGHFNIGLFVVSYALTSASSIGVFYYTVISSGQDISLSHIVIFVLTVGLANVVCELYIRKKLRLIAAGCLSGRKLKDYAKHPWLYLDEKNKKTLFIMYFDVPELSKWALSRQTADVKKVEENILETLAQKVGEHDGLLARRSEDSAIVVFELPKRLEAKSFSTTERYSAYHALLCALELKNSMEGLKETFNINLVKNLKGRSVVVKDSGTIIRHIRNGRMEVSLFSDGLYRIGDMLQQSKEDDVVCDSQVYEECSNYFTAKKLSKGLYQVQGLSAYSEAGL